MSKEYVWHYTSIPTLMLILENKQIKFNSLKNVDDIHEGETKNIGKLGKYIYVSCFTEDNDENIDLWTRYGVKGKGVRIRLDKNPFKIQERAASCISIGTISIQALNENEIERENIILNRSCVSAMDMDIVKVEYLSSDNEALRPHIPEEVDINIGYLRSLKLGRIKSDDWSQQNESRYIKYLIPSKNEDSRDNINISNGYMFEFLSDNAIKSMEITFGYDISEEERANIIKYIDDWNLNNNGNIVFKNSNIN